MRVLVCGGRDWCDILAMLNVMDEIDEKEPISVLIHGGARGADDEARMWGELREKKVLAFPADWKTHGKAAGPIRNQRMIDEGKPDLVVAFPGGRGTADMTQRVLDAGIRLYRVFPRTYAYTDATPAHGVA